MPNIRGREGRWIHSSNLSNTLCAQIMNLNSLNIRTTTSLKSKCDLKHNIIQSYDARFLHKNWGFSYLSSFRTLLFHPHLHRHLPFQRCPPNHRWRGFPIIFFFVLFLRFSSWLVLIRHHQGHHERRWRTSLRCRMRCDDSWMVTSSPARSPLSWWRKKICGDLG